VYIVHTSSEETAAAVAACGEVVVMTVGAVQLVVLAGERVIDKRHLAVTTLETFLVPVTILVRQVLQHTSDSVNITIVQGSLPGRCISQETIGITDCSTLCLIKTTQL